MPLLNQVDSWLEQSVRSALAQTVLCEVIVVCSSRTRESNTRLLASLAAGHPGLRVEREPLQGGFAAAINHGIRLASADRIGLLLSDDWLNPRAVECSLPHLVDIVSTDVSVYLADGQTLAMAPGWPRSLQEFEKRTTLEERARYLKHFFLFRRMAILEAGGLDESLGDYPGIDDFDLIWTMLERGATVAIVPTSLYNYRDHDGERLTLRDREQAQRTLERILEKHGLRGDEMARILAIHLPWYGRTVHAAQAAIAAGDAQRRRGPA
jgi:GT2 family glycosyltransferase